MKGLISFVVKRSIATAVLVLVVVAFGAYNYLLLKLDMFPELTFPTVVIVTTYTGAGPADIETLVSRPIEQAVASVKGVKKLRSYSQSGSSIVLAEFNWGHDMKAAEREVQKYLDIFNQVLPEDVEKPIAFSIDTSLMPVMMLGVSGPYPPAEVRKIAKDIVKPRLDRVDGVAAVDIEGGQQRQINVFIDPQRMRALGISATTVVNALRAANMQVPGGQVDDGDKAYNIQTEGQFVSVDEINHVIVGNRRGRMLTVADVADVQDGFVEVRSIARDNGEDSVMLSVRRQSDANTVLTARAVRKAIEEMKSTLPAGIKINMLSDQSEIISRSISNLADTGWQALLITMLVLLVFLGSFRGSIVVGVTMPVSLIATFGVMGQMGVTLNMISMAGLALAIGMLVDNSVVVVENVFRHFKKGGVSAAEASVQGTSEVAVAVTAATLCHLVVFGPILFVPGFASQIFRDMALTICFSLFISLFVALTLMPMLTARLMAGGLSFDIGTRRRVSPFKSIAAGVDRIVPFYVGLLDRSFRHKKKVLFSGSALFALSIAASALWLNVDFMAPSDVGHISLAVKVQPGTTVSDFDGLVRRAEKAIFAEVPEAQAVDVQFGETEGFGAFFGGQSASVGSIYIKLPPIKQRSRRQSEIETAVLKRLARIPGITATVRQEMSFSSGQGDIEIKVVQDDLGKLREEAQNLVRRIEKLDDVRSVEFSMELGRPQLGVRLDRERLKALGMVPAEVVGSISAYFQGNKAGVFRDGGDEYDILVRAPREQRESARLLGEVPLVTPAGKVVPLRAVSSLNEDVGPVTIERYNQRRVGVISVYKKPSAPLGPLSDKVKKITAGRTDIDIGGAASDMEESFMYLAVAFIVSIFLVYGVMAALFESLLEPFVIIFSIPVMWIGVAAMLILTRTTLQITASIGLIILVGIVVNNAIVLVDYLKQLRERGTPLVEAALEAGRARLRPVLMTACTTTLAMIPLAIELGEGSETWSPMARTVIGGLAASTILTLFIVPIIYVMIAGFLDRRRARTV